MKAVVVHAANDLRVEERPDPTPGPGQVLMALEWGGICGSDIAYVNHGASGTAILRHPLVLGHEVAGRVVAVGEGVAVPLGLRAAVCPPIPDPGQKLPDRIAGRTNLYPRVRYFGSAAQDPHTDGGFCQLKAVDAAQLRPLPDNVDTRQGSLAEPLAVAVHAVHRAGEVAGREVLVNGAGPIGCLVIGVLRHLGASRIWAADVSEASLEIARRMGATDTVNVTTQALPEDIELSFEASGVAAALGGVLHAVARGGRLVQVGNLSASPVVAVLGDLVTREIDWVGSFRFVDEMDDAIAMMAAGLDVGPVMTHEFELSDAEAAFATASDRSTGSCKVLLRLDES